MLCYGEKSKIIIVKAQLTHCPPGTKIYIHYTLYNTEKKERRKNENVIDIESKIQSTKRPYTNIQTYKQTKVLDQLRSNMRTQRWQTLTSFSNWTSISTMQCNWPMSSQHQPFQNMPRKKNITREQIAHTKYSSHRNNTAFVTTFLYPKNKNYIRLYSSLSIQKFKNQSKCTHTYVHIYVVYHTTYPSRSQPRAPQRDFQVTFLDMICITIHYYYYT